MNALARLQALESAVDARTRRERLLLAGACLVFVLLIWDVFVRAPLTEGAEQERERAQQLSREADALEATVTELERKLRTGGTGDETVALLRQQIQRLDEALADRTTRVVSPQQMVTVLREMLAEAPGLSLVAMRNHDPEPIISENKQGANEVPRVYRHRVELVLRGDYFSAQGYLERLEALDWRFQWDGVALKTLDYPGAEITVTVSTLSLAEDWVGV